MHPRVGSIWNCFYARLQGFTLAHYCLVCHSPAILTVRREYRVQLAKIIMESFARLRRDTIFRWLNLRSMTKTRLFFTIIRVTSLQKVGSITTVPLMTSFMGARPGVD